VSRGIKSFIGIYIIAVADSVTFQLYLQCDFYYHFLITYLLIYSMEQSSS